MGLPKKRKNNIQVYNQYPNSDTQTVLQNREDLLKSILKSDSYLPDSILHDDLDLGFLEYIKNKFIVLSDGAPIPVIDKILTIQRWGEYTNNWTFSDSDGNIKLPFIAVVRKPEVQLGTNPSLQRTIPNRRQEYYLTVPTWNGNQVGADVYTIPQPIAVDITFEVSIVCTKFRDLNKLNKIVMEHFSSRQDYTTVKGHYIPIVLDRIEDNTPMETLDGRRFYLQKYTFTMLGFLIDSEEFQVKPAINRNITSFEVDTQNTVKNPTENNITISSSYHSGSIVANYTATTQFKVDKTIKISFTDVLSTSTGNSITIPVDIFIETNQSSGTTQNVIVGNYNDLLLQNVFTEITVNSIGRSKFNFQYTEVSNFSPHTHP